MSCRSSNADNAGATTDVSNPSARSSSTDMLKCPGATGCVAKNQSTTGVTATGPDTTP